MLSVEHLTVNIKGRAILRDVSLQVPQGTVVGLLGPNGAGKTTCFRAILGEIRHGTGSVKLDGDEVSETPMHLRARQGIGYLCQEASVFRGLTVSKNIMAVLQLRQDLSKPRRETELRRLLRELEISHLSESMASVLSGGERRRVEIARALAADPKYILLDEPFAGVDPVSIGEIRALVSQITTGEIGVLITDHNVQETLRLCDHAYILTNGKVLASGTPAEIIANEAVREAYLGESFQI